MKKNSIIIKLIKKIYYSYRKWSMILLSHISPVLASKVFYRRCTRKKLNLKNPQNFNEKLMYIKLKNYNHNDLVFKCSDKYQVREYALAKGVSIDNLPKIIKKYSSTKEINFNELPKKFVLKCSHGCGFNIVCTDKEKLNYEETIKKIKKWSKTKFGYETAETHYTHVKPTIFCEEFIDNDGKGFPNDYKLYCFNGIPKIVLICSNRDKNLRLNYYNIAWEELPYGPENLRSKAKEKKPKSFDQMLEIAKKISKGFPYVRCDFYEYNGKAVLGEMTFTPAGCAATYYTEQGLKEIGDMLEIKAIKKES